MRVSADQWGRPVSTAREQHFIEVYIEHYADVFGYLLRRTSLEDAQDAVSEVFTVAWRRLDQLPADLATLPWLYGVAAKVLANQRRGDRRRQALRSRISTARAIPASSQESPSDSVDGNVEIIAALDSLSEQDRELVLLNTWEGLPASQIALRYEISLKAAEKRLTRAKSRLAAALQVADHSLVATRTSDLDAESEY